YSSAQRAEETWAANEMAALVAYYLAEVAQGAEKKPAIEFSGWIPAGAVGTLGPGGLSGRAWAGSAPDCRVRAGRSRRTIDRPGEPTGRPDGTRTPRRPDPGESSAAWRCPTRSRPGRTDLPP